MKFFLLNNIFPFSLVFLIKDLEFQEISMFPVYLKLTFGVWKTTKICILSFDHLEISLNIVYIIM